MIKHKNDQLRSDNNKGESIMKTTLTIFAALALMAGCSACNKGQEFKGVITHEYDVYLSKFNEDLARLGYGQIDFSGLEIKEINDLVFGDKNYQGYCHEITLKRSGAARISLNKHFKNNQPEIKGLQIYHEIGHCYLGIKNHPEGKAIMNIGNLGMLFSIEDFKNDEKRLKLVKEMVESSNYR